MLFYLTIMILVSYGNYVIIAQVIIKEKYINISKKLNEGYINEKNIIKYEAVLV